MDLPPVQIRFRSHAVAGSTNGAGRSPRGFCCVRDPNRHILARGISMASGKIVSGPQGRSPVRQKVLELLAGTDADSPRSSHALSRQLQVPVSEIRKAIAELRKDDYGITGRPYSGYYLERLPDSLEEGLIRYDYMEPWYTFSLDTPPTPLPDFFCFASAAAADAHLAENRFVLPNGALAVADGALASDDHQTDFAGLPFLELHHRLVHLAFLLKGAPPGGAGPFLSGLTDRFFQKIRELAENRWEGNFPEWKFSGDRLFCAGKRVAAVTAERLDPDTVLIKVDAGLNHIAPAYNFPRSRLAARLIQCWLDEGITESPRS